MQAGYLLVNQTSAVSVLNQSCYLEEPTLIGKQITNGRGECSEGQEKEALWELEDGLRR